MDPWQIVVALAGALVATYTALAAAVFRGDLVPGHVYRREVKRGDTATTQSERTTDALRDLTFVVRAAIDERDTPTPVTPRRGGGHASGG